MSDSKIFDQKDNDIELSKIVDNYDLQPLSVEMFRSDRVDELWSLTDKGFKPLAWTPNVRYLLYNEEKGILIHDVEGDIYIWKDPSEELIGEQVEQYPKMEVSVGEKYDSRFDWGCR